MAVPPVAILQPALDAGPPQPLVDGVAVEEGDEVERGDLLLCVQRQKDFREIETV